MNAERLHAIVKSLRAEVEDTGYPGQLVELFEGLTTLSDAPGQAEAQQRVSAAREALNEVLQSAGSNDFSPVWREVIAAGALRPCSAPPAAALTRCSPPPGLVHPRQLLALKSSTSRRVPVSSTSARSDFTMAWSLSRSCPLHHFMTPSGRRSTDFFFLAGPNRGPVDPGGRGPPTGGSLVLDTRHGKGGTAARMLAC